MAFPSGRRQSYAPRSEHAQAGLLSPYLLQRWGAGEVSLSWMATALKLTAVRPDTTAERDRRKPAGSSPRRPQVGALLKTSPARLGDPRHLAGRKGRRGVGGEICQRCR